MRVRFSTSPAGCDRIHHVSEDDVRTVLARLPDEVLKPLRTVYFNDHSRGGRCLGYANPPSGEITLCALAPRLSLTRALLPGQSPEQFGARRGRQWPALAVRRFLLYDVLLHELGHLQPLACRSRSQRLRFPREKLAEEFAMKWRRILWAKSDHPDPVHNRASAAEISALSKFQEERN